MNLPDTKIAVTLFNLREYCKTKADLEESLSKVKDIGYQVVQVSALPNLEPQDIKESLEKHGLFCCATHENLQTLTEGFNKVVEKLKILECDFTALASPPPEFFNADGMQSFIKTMEEIGKKYAEKGLKLGFHNHHHEFQRFDGKLFLEELYDNTDPAHVYAEIDTHWVARGGQDPAKWICKVKGRMPVVHFKDLMIIDTEPHFCEVGEGNLHWDDILKACNESDVRWYVVEQDCTIGERSIFESIKISYNNLVKMGVK